MGLRQALVRPLSPLVRWVCRGRARILMYHRFGVDEWGLRMTPDVFAAQMQYIRRRFRPCRLSDLVGMLERGVPLPDDLVAVTVDDAYHDFGEVAYPVLKELGVPSTIFVVSASADQTHWLWFDAVRYLIWHAPAGTHEIRIADETMRVSLHAERARRLESWHAVADACLPLPARPRWEAVLSVGERLGLALPAAPPSEFRALDWDELRALDPGIVDIGSHTRTHPILSQCSPAELDAELQGSKRAIERQLGRAAGLFCYPNGQPGDYNAETREAVGRAGYRCAVVAHGSLVGPRDDLFTLGRLSADDTLPRFRNGVDGYRHVKMSASVLIQRAWSALGAGRGT
jgi:peptidoglycan/xylan/chitin deacetylase (PgdA/CDA1 family)